MVQSALKDSGKSPLGIQPFWEKATLEHPLRWENWKTQLKLAIRPRRDCSGSPPCRPSWPTTVPAHKYKAKVANVTGLNFMVSRRRTFPQQAHWHLQVPQEQRNEKTLYLEFVIMSMNKKGKCQYGMLKMKFSD